jgi:hypothetical protein
MELFGKLFEGATAFRSLSGIYQPKKGLRAWWDEPIMVQSLTKTENLADEKSLMELADFCQHMGKRTNQRSIGVVVNNLFIDIPVR